MIRPTAPLIAVAAALVGVAVIFAACSSPPSQSDHRVIDDRTIASDVKAKLDHDFVRANDIQVTTYNGSVQLTGYVDSLELRNKAAVVAGQVEGVKQLTNSLQVRKSPARELPRQS